MPWALEAVLAEVDADAIVFGGDFIGGPCPEETLALVALGRRASAMRGNADDRRPTAGRDAAARRPSSTAYATATRRRQTNTPITTAITPDDDLRRACSATRARSSSGTRTISSTGASASCASSTPARSAWRTRARSRRSGRSSRTASRGSARRRSTSSARSRGIRASGWQGGEEFIAENLLVAVDARRGDRVLRGAAMRVAIGKVGRPHGIDGAFFVEQPSDDARWWKTGATFLAGGTPVEVVAHRTSSGRPVIKVEPPVERGALLEVERDAAAADGRGRVLRVRARRARGRGGDRPRARNGRGRDPRRRERRARARHAACCCRWSRTACARSISTRGASTSPKDSPD